MTFDAHKFMASVFSTPGNGCHSGKHTAECDLVQRAYAAGLAKGEEIARGAAGNVRRDINQRKACPSAFQALDIADAICAERERAGKP
jgi:hypothetical protein